MLENVQIVLRDIGRLKKNRDGINLNNHDVHEVRAERYVEVDFGDFREDNDDSKDGDFEVETLKQGRGFWQPRN
jgi:hypothetical protein